jgi:hypothetical protein
VGLYVPLLEFNPCRKRLPSSRYYGEQEYMWPDLYSTLEQAGKQILHSAHDRLGKSRRGIKEYVSSQRHFWSRPSSQSAPGPARSKPFESTGNLRMRKL